MMKVTKTMAKARNGWVRVRVRARARVSEESSFRSRNGAVASFTNYLLALLIS